MPNSQVGWVNLSNNYRGIQFTKEQEKILSFVKDFHDELKNACGNLQTFKKYNGNKFIDICNFPQQLNDEYVTYAWICVLGNNNVVGRHIFPNLYYNNQLGYKTYLRPYYVGQGGISDYYEYNYLPILVACGYVVTNPNNIIKVTKRKHLLKMETRYYDIVISTKSEDIRQATFEFVKATPHGFNDISTAFELQGKLGRIDWIH